MTYTFRFSTTAIIKIITFVTKIKLHTIQDKAKSLTVYMLYYFDDDLNQFFFKTSLQFVYIQKVCTKLQAAH